MLKNIPNGFYIYNEIVFKNKLYFSANDGLNGQELWVSDGTTAGTRLVKDISLDSSEPGGFTEFNNKLYFSADDGVHGDELWVTNGTKNGTQLLVDINPGSSENYFGDINPDTSQPGGFTEFNNKLLFSADDGIHGRELWVTDGIKNGTQLVKDIFPGISEFDYFNSSNPDNFTLFKNKLYFTADDSVNGTGIWVTDGTKNGTQLVADIVGDEPYGPDPTNFVICNDKIYFIARDRINGVELWVTDGTTNGTQLVKDIFPGIYEDYFGKFPNGSFPENLTVLNNKLYFTANDGVNGRELWVTDGTEKGTQLLKDIIPGSEGSLNFYDSGFLTVFDDKLYFTTDDSVNNTELWVSDGTENGTQFVDDINPGSPHSYAGELTVVGKELFLFVGNSTTGQELFKLSIDNSTKITGTKGADNLKGTKGADTIKGLKSRDILSGKAGNDTLIGGKGKDSLNGGKGNDSLLGGSASDRLKGGKGNDVLDGGSGFNVLKGGIGNDLFVIREGNSRDKIVDFKLGSDLIGLADGLEFEDLTLSDNKIKFGNDWLATLDGIKTSNLTESDFTAI
jgi:ELWxxDGT repeat protein